MFFLEQPRLRVETLCPELAEGFLGLASAASKRVPRLRRMRPFVIWSSFGSWNYEPVF